MQQVALGNGQGVSWQPAADVVDHNGEPLGVDSDFFCPPPLELGKVISARTTLKKSKQPKSTLAGYRASQPAPLLVAQKTLPSAMMGEP